MVVFVCGFLFLQQNQGRVEGVDAEAISSSTAQRLAVAAQSVRVDQQITVEQLLKRQGKIILQRDIFLSPLY